MKFISTRDIRNRPGLIQEQVNKEDLVLTSNGKPVALVLRIENDDLEQTMRVIRQARAMQAVSRMRQRAEELGLDKMTLEEINEEIQAVRRQRKSK